MLHLYGFLYYVISSSKIKLYIKFRLYSLMIVMTWIALIIIRIHEFLYITYSAKKNRMSNFITRSSFVITLYGTVINNIYLFFLLKFSLLSVTVKQLLV